MGPDPQQESCTRQDPAQTHSAAPGLLGEESPVVVYRFPHPRPQVISSPWLPRTPGRERQYALLGSARPGSAPFGPTRSRSAPLGSEPDRCVEPQRPLLGQSSAARPAAAERLRTGAAGCGSARRRMELCRQGNTREVPAWCPVHRQHAVGFAVPFPDLF